MARCVLMLAAALAVVLATAATGVQAEAVAQCWFPPSSFISGILTLTQADATSAITITGELTTSLGQSQSYSAFVRTYGDLYLGSNLGACYQSAAAFQFTYGTDAALAVSTTSTATLYGTSSIVGRSLALYNGQGAGCETAIAGNLAGQCVVGIGSVPAWPANEANVNADSSLNFTAAVAGLFNPAGDAIGWASFAPNLATLGTALPEIVVSITAFGLVPYSVHSTHIHWYGNMSTSDGLSVGGHYNPLNSVHGGPYTLVRHAGDMGNVTVGADGNITWAGSFNLMTWGGVNNILGRAIVLHAQRDDGNPSGSITSTGDAGARIARGVIGLSARRPKSVNPAYGVCTFTPELNVVGHILLQQFYPGGPVHMSGNLTGNSAASTATLNVFANTYGDLKNFANAGACFGTRSAPLASWSSTNGAQSTIDTLITDGSLSLFAVDSAVNIIGRTLTVTSASSCTTGAQSTDVAQCVVGIHSIGTYVNNQALQTLSTAPAGAHAKLTRATTNANPPTSGGPLPSDAFTGEVHFSPSSITDEVYVFINASGLAANSVHSVHVHWYGDITGTDGWSTGGHMNPFGRNHGWAPSLERHQGDIGNVTADSNGVITFGGNFNLLQLTGSNSVIGRGVILHALRDDGNPLNTTASTGAAGDRWGRGVVGISSRTAPIVPTFASSTGSSSSSNSSSSSSTGTKLNAASSTASPVLALFAAAAAAVAAVAML